jgi:hypothetical protein
MNTFGLWTGIATLLIIGGGFIWVIRGERYLGVLWWPYFMGFGFFLIFLTLWIPSTWGAALLGVLGSSFVWGSTELKDQAVRAELGWYPFRKKKIQPPFARILRKWCAPNL